MGSKIIKKKKNVNSGKNLNRPRGKATENHPMNNFSKSITIEEFYIYVVFVILLESSMEPTIGRRNGATGLFIKRKKKKR